jgi:hypothetical protein
MRKLTSATCVHKDFVSAVMDVDYAPTGKEFVAGSYDRSVRIFSRDAGHSREVYTTKRMQRVFQKSNTYNALHQMYEELGTFGTAATILLTHTSACSRTIGSFSITSACAGTFVTFLRPTALNGTG